MGSLLSILFCSFHGHRRCLSACVLLRSRTLFPGVSQQQLDQLSAQLPRVQQRQANGQLGPEGSLKWLDGEPVEQWQLRRLVGLPSVWTVHDLIWNQQVCYASVQFVCAKV
jgi:hypothetical protein